MPRPHTTVAHGFSLIELALTLTILALLGGGLISSIVAQRSQAQTQQARQQLEQAIEALYGHALVHGRLPCPAAPNLASTQPMAGQEDCTRQHGVLPWVTLALPETDLWGQRLTYHAASAFSAVAPTGNVAFALDTEGIADVQDGTGKTVAGKLPAVVVSHGARGAGAWLSDGSQRGGASGDELENADADPLFINRPTGADFDDLVAWVIPGILKARLVASGRLP